METPKMKLTKEQLKNIIKEELGKIMDEKIELGNYKDRKKKSICAQIDQKIYDGRPDEEAAMYGYESGISSEEMAQLRKAYKEAGCEELDKEEQRQFEKDQAEKKRKQKMRDYPQGITDTMKVARTYQTREDIQRMVEEELAAVTKGN